jgi:hypothetical protein
VCGTGGTCIVFATDGIYNGDFGGLTGADAVCNAHASAAGLPGTYKAWLSDGTISAADRLSHNPGPYQRVDGAVVAANWVDLTDGFLSASINLTEYGVPTYEDYDAYEVWTNTTPAGAIVGGNHCGNWGFATDDVSGALGLPGNTDGLWTETDSHTHRCSDELGLYCFQHSA